MADVRAMLRQQRATRQQASKPPRQSAAPAAAPASKKRKAADESAAEERKRTRTEQEAGVPAGFFDQGTAGDEPASEELQDANPPPVPQIAQDAELDAFMEEMSKPQPIQEPAAAYAPGAVIESAPLTAAEIAAQAREEQSAQRARRDEEMEGEKEDAVRQLEDEFEEMDDLEERVRKLREQREALRGKPVQAPIEEDIVLPTPELEDDDSDSDEDDEDWDDWRFHPA